MTLNTTPRRSAQSLATLAEDRHVGARLHECRVLKGMSQLALAKHLGVSFQQVQKYEKGDNRIGAGRLYHIARLFDVPVSFFFDGLTDGVQARATDGRADRLLMEINRRWPELSASQRRAVRDVVAASADLTGKLHGVGRLAS